MSAQQEKIYRVNVQGLSQTEKTVFGGMIHLSGQKGIRLEFEPLPENSDVVILDGADQRSVELSRSNALIAQRTIWINPPEHLRATRHVGRPLHWPHLLMMVERMVGAVHEAPVAAQEQPAFDMTVSQLYILSESILRTHIGVAAEFVIGDVRDSMKNAHAGGNEQRISDIFLTCLQQQLPKNVDAGKIVQQISAAIAQGRVK
ncbi:MAG: hypothetical protein Q8K23_03450 [Sulfuritalea sp.]|nr:hypothetical protein [Sulfuritalea sp.]